MYIIFQFWRLEVTWAKDQGASRLHSYLEGPGKNPFLCLFCFLEAAHLPWLVAPSSNFEASNIGLSSFHAIISGSLLLLMTLVITLVPLG